MDKNNETKVVRVTLTELTRSTYVQTVRVPASLTQAQLQELCFHMYKKVDGREFKPVEGSSERGNCYAQLARDNDEVTGVVTLDGGKFKFVSTVDVQPYQADNSHLTRNGAPAISYFIGNVALTNGDRQNQETFLFDAGCDPKVRIKEIADGWNETSKPVEGDTPGIYFGGDDVEVEPGMYRQIPRETFLSLQGVMARK